MPTVAAVKQTQVVSVPAELVFLVVPASHLFVVGLDGDRRPPFSQKARRVAGYVHQLKHRTIEIHGVDLARIDLSASSRKENIKRNVVAADGDVVHVVSLVVFTEGVAVVGEEDDRGFAVSHQLLHKGVDSRGDVLEAHPRPLPQNSQHLRRDRHVVGMQPGFADQVVESQQFVELAEAFREEAERVADVVGKVGFHQVDGDEPLAALARRFSVSIITSLWVLRSQALPALAFDSKAMKLRLAIVSRTRCQSRA